MIIEKGEKIYNADVAPVIAQGYQYNQEKFEKVKNLRLPSILNDECGTSLLSELYNNLHLTNFGTNYITQVLQLPQEEEHSKGWREGEAFAEAWLIDHRQCEFPWPFGRDKRHPQASLPGADFVGFTGSEDDAKLAFGQVKTSKEGKYPPQVVTNGSTSLINQSLQLRDDKNIQHVLVNYLSFRSKGASWETKFKKAVSLFLNSQGKEFFIFGMLLRDVAPQKKDLERLAKTLQQNCHTQTQIEFYCLYFPANSIQEGPQHAARKKENNNASSP